MIKQLKAALKERNLTQSGFSLLTKMSLQKINLILNGHRRITLEEYEVFCYVLNVPVGTFLEARKPKATRKE